jgi:peptidyl-prolyl cis-trans isomerase C
MRRVPRRGPLRPRYSDGVVVLALVCGLSLSACREDRPVALSHSAELPSGIVARVGNEDVSVETVARIASAAGVSPEAARDRAVADALFASGLRADPSRTALVAVSERGVLARMLLENLREKARGGGPASEAEVESQTRERWLELDRPESVRVTHAVVLTKSAADDAPAKALAHKLADAVRGVQSSAEFLRRANALPKEALELRAEALPPVFPDGRMWDPAPVPPQRLSGTLDPDFTRAAHALHQPGQQSPILKTPFGYHVILLDERLPAVKLSFEERRERLTDVVLALRAKAELDALLEGLKQQTPVELPRSVDELTARVLAAP